MTISSRFYIQSIAEELLFRGCVFDNLLGSFTLTKSCFIQAIIFSFVHLLNGSASVILFLTLIFFGLLMVLFRIIVNNLFLSSGFHFVWNCLPSLLLGINVSGIEIPFSIFKLRISGHEFYTGGDFGIEGSLIVLLIFIFLTVSIYTRYR
ncbi:CPBP family intramembrane glutamic endopeptidase, partial [Ligilactobacillus apodemi]|uniref:CPBP family intramembrane glutamic endopeptidase n=1 Tax=Ligilactobacillus apodemi TaxID=307126 RepID=UPI0034E29085